MKKRVELMWVLTGVCLVLAIIFWFKMNNVEVEYDLVTAIVTDTSSKDLINKNTHNRTTFYKVKVRYEGKEYELQNVHGLSGYYKGASVKALLYNDKLYANEEGIKSSSPTAIVYFVFLFGTFGMIMASSIYMSKVKSKN